ncbi:hypothetical protein [Paenibacillus validus]|uniref:hypothetical protein n=1 Tax=Paenibacillus validus TaxID=44253 RepID=UPI003D28EAF0
MQQAAQAGAEVRVIMTASAVKFVAPLTFQTLSRHEVAVDTFDEKDASVVQHIDLATVRTCSSLRLRRPT